MIVPVATPLSKNQGDVQYRSIALLVTVFPLALTAAEPVKLADNKAAPKFISLDSIRKDNNDQGQKPIALEQTAKPKLLSDKQQMKSGFMRIDRARAAPVAVQSNNKVIPATNDQVKVIATSPAPVEPESEEILGNTETVDPVLALFDTEQAGALSSFRDALSGRTLSANVTRHLGWPVPTYISQYISSGYGMRTDPFHGRPTFHGGIDIVAPVGTPVVATANGRVSEVKTDMNYGKYITIEHTDGTLSRYGHLNSQHVTEGQNVRMGEAIGTIGSTGRSTGAHLDYRVSKNGIKFDPLSVLTTPSNVAFKGTKSPLITAYRAPAKVASNALPKRPMVIQVK